MKILINRKTVNSAWGGGNKFVRGFWDYASNYGVEVTAKFSADIDAILVIGSEPYPDVGIGINEILRFKSAYPHVKLVYRMNDHNLCKDARNAFDGAKRAYSRFCEGTIFVSKWLEEYYLEKKERKSTDWVKGYNKWKKNK